MQNHWCQANTSLLLLILMCKFMNISFHAAYLSCGFIYCKSLTKCFCLSRWQTWNTNKCLLSQDVFIVFSCASVLISIKLAIWASRGQSPPVYTWSDVGYTYVCTCNRNCAICVIPPNFIFNCRPTVIRFDCLDVVTLTSVEVNLEWILSIIYTVGDLMNYQNNNKSKWLNKCFIKTAI